MTRAEFIKAYAKRSGVNHHPYALLGFLDCGGRVLIALPCACGDEGCEGWAMMSAEHVDHHLQFRAPEPLRSAYLETMEAFQGE
jgi:hypothetical protein